jgi:hypothetical protein
LAFSGENNPLDIFRIGDSDARHKSIISIGSILRRDERRRPKMVLVLPGVRRGRDHSDARNHENHGKSKNADVEHEAPPFCVP